jgi:DNA-binding NarL/FixJ family response regulator
MSEEAHHIQKVLQTGVHGYVMKSVEKPELVKAIKTVFGGEKYFSEKIVKKLAEIQNIQSPNGKARIEDIIPNETRDRNSVISSRRHVLPTGIETKNPRLTSYRDLMWVKD